MAEENEKPAEPQEGQSQPGSGSDAPSESAPPWAAEPVVVVDPADEFEEDGSALPFLVCGIGASAGGVEAYIELFGSLAPDTGIAYVLVPHLMPDQKSHLVEILSRHTPMQVAEIVPGTVPEPDHVYILPPGVRATLKRGAFELRSRITDGAPRSIDEFFRSLAADQKARSVGVVLSGTDADGALGLKAIKGEGGITMVQSPESVPLDVTTGLYRITQEALRNVSKHAGKTDVKVSLKADAGRIRLQIADSGEGFDPHARRSGLGLISMEERARIMQGTLHIESEPGEGTKVTVSVPLAAQQ